MGMYRSTKIGGTRITRSNRGIAASRTVTAGLTRVTLSTRKSGQSEFVRTSSKNSGWTRIFQRGLGKFPEETQYPKKLRSITL